MAKIDWAEWDEFLEVVLDEDLSAIIGCSRHAVSARRKKVLGLEQPKPTVWGPLVGTVPDNELAELHGVAPRTVRRLRELRGIRPVGTPGARAECLVRVRFTPDELALIEEAAAREGIRVREWCRRKLFRLC